MVGNMKRFVEGIELVIIVQVIVMETEAMVLQNTVGFIRNGFLFLKHSSHMGRQCCSEVD